MNGRWRCGIAVASGAGRGVEVGEGGATVLAARDVLGQEPVGLGGVLAGKAPQDVPRQELVDPLVIR